MNGILLSRHFLRALGDAGIIPKETQRVVIDAQLDNVVMLYVMQLGTEQLLRVIPSLEGIKIQIVGEDIEQKIAEERQEEGDGVADWVVEGREWPSSSRS